MFEYSNYLIMQQNAHHKINVNAAKEIYSQKENKTMRLNNLRLVCHRMTPIQHKK